MASDRQPKHFYRTFERLTVQEERERNEDFIEQMRAKYPVPMTENNIPFSWLNSNIGKTLGHQKFQKFKKQLLEDCYTKFDALIHQECGESTRR